MENDRWPARDGQGAVIERARRGERDAFDILVRDYANMVTGLAHRLLGSADEALDCAQDAFVKAWENIDRYDPKWSMATWLRRIVTNLALDRLRRRRTRADLPESFGETFASSAEKPDAAAERKEEARAVREMLDVLPEKYRTVLV
jgi:RNA polymerase sigma-70 factor (ECF subfamily)